MVILGKEPLASLGAEVVR